MNPDKMAVGIQARLGSSRSSNGEGTLPSGPPPRVPDHDLLRRIGGGSYGDVWLARSVTGRWHAVKVVWRHNFSSDRPYEREFRGIVQFEPISRSHPGVINILHVGRDDPSGCFYYVMELADDASSGNEKSEAPTVGVVGPVHAVSFSSETYRPRTLGAELTMRGRMSVTQVLELGVQLANALGHVHRNGLVHRDVKPSNVIFVNGQAKLADIGLVTGKDEARSFVGTEGFIPPEGPGTVQADLFALGRLLYEASTGKDRCEFPDMPTDLDKWPDREVMLELNEVLAKACAPEAARRHGNSAELAGDLNLILAGRSVRRAYGVERRLRRATQVAAAAAVVVMLAAAAVWFLRGQRDRSEELAREQSALRERAEQAERQGQERLRESLLQQARALTGSGEQDRRARALAALRQAAEIRPGLDLRNAAAAALASPELRILRRWSVPPDGSQNSRPDTRLRQYSTPNADGSVSVHQIEDDTEVVRLPSLQVGADFGVFSPDASRLAVKYADGELRVWNLAARTNLLVVRGVQGFGFSPDNRWLVAGCSEGHIHRVDLKLGREMGQETGRTVGDELGFHPSESFYLTAGERPTQIQIRRLNDGGVFRTLDVPEMGFIAQWSADGKTLLTSHRDNSIRVWDWPATDRPRLILRFHQAEPVYLATDPAGRWLATAGWDTRSGVFDLRDGHLVFSHAGTRLHAATDRPAFLLINDRIQSLVEFDPSFAFETIAIHEKFKSPRDIAFSPNGRWLATGGEDGVRVLDRGSGEVHRLMDDEGSLRLAFSGDSRQLYSVTPERLRVWRTEANLETGFLQTEAVEQPQDGRRGYTDSVVAGIFPERKRWLAVALNPKTRNWSWINGSFDSTEIEFLDGITANSHAPEFSKDGKWLAWGNWRRRNAYVLRLGTNNPPIELPVQGSATAAFSPDSRLLVIGGSDEVQFYRTSEWRRFQSLPRHPVSQLPPFFAFTGDSQICAASLPPNHVLLIDTATGKELATLPAATHILNRCAFSPDGRFLAVASTEHHALIWDLTKLRGKLRELGLDWTVSGVASH